MGRYEKVRLVHIGSNGRVGLMKKLLLLATMLTMVLAGAVPALGQVLGSPERLPEDDLIVEGNSPLGGSVIADCGEVFGIEDSSSPLPASPEGLEQDRQLCIDAGYIPPTSTGVQYDNADTTRCVERQADGFCSTYIGPDGSINQAQPA